MKSVLVDFLVGAGIKVMWQNLREILQGRGESVIAQICLLVHQRGMWLSSNSCYVITYVVRVKSIRAAVMC